MAETGILFAMRRMPGLLCSVPMRLLIEIATTCCAVMLAAAAALWWTTRAEQQRRVRLAENVPLRRVGPHPRTDLAAGLVPPAQSVRPRSRGQGIQRDERTAAPAFNHPKRPDWAYYNKDMGDLRDPDIGVPPAGGVLRPTGSLSRPESR